MSSFTINVFNSQAPKNKRIIVTGILEQVDLQETVDGEVIWILRLETNFNGINGQSIDPIYINNVTQATLKDEVLKGTSLIAAQIDWAPIEEDTKPPFVFSVTPKVGQENVDITSIVQATIKDSFPTVGIDPSTIKMRVNNIDVTPAIDIGGKDNEFTITWYPPRKLD